MRKRYQKDSLANMKNSGEIHEQLVTYDEEGGGEMDTNGYARTLFPPNQSTGAVVSIGANPACGPSGPPHDTGLGWGRG